jgi:phage shock protein C
MSEAKKRLYRSRSERMLAGVCGGIGDYFDVDPTVIRLLFVVFALVIGGGILLYIILLILVPLEPETAEPVEVVTTEDSD